MFETFHLLQEREFISVFVPLIGPKAAFIYVLMTDLIPQAGANPFFKLSIRTIATAGGLTKPGKKPNPKKPGTFLPTYNTAFVSRALNTLIAIGMLEMRESDNPNEAPTFYLKSLRDLAAVGIDELKARIGVSGGNTSDDDEGDESAEDDTREDAKEGSESDDSLEGSGKAPSNAAASPEASGKSSVSGGNTFSRNSNSGVIEQIAATSDDEVFQKGGGGVSPGAIGVSPEELFVAKKASLIKPHQIKPSLTPNGVELILPVEDMLSTDPTFPMSLGIAARWVMDRRGISDKRMVSVICDALSQRCRIQKETLQVATELLDTNAAKYQELKTARVLAMEYDWRSFIGGGHWQFPHMWRVKESAQKEQRALARAQVGYQPSPTPDIFTPDRVAAFVTENAEQMESSGRIECATELHELAKKAAEGMSLDELDKKLTDCEQRLFAALLAEGGDVLTAARAGVERQIEEQKPRMNELQLAGIRQQAVHKRLFELHGLPRLSLFYIPTGS